MKFRIALCLYGQPRTWEYCAPWINEAFKSHTENTRILQNLSSIADNRAIFERVSSAEIEVDKFVHVKKYNTFANSSKSQTQYVSDEEIARLVAAFQPVAHEVISYEDDYAQHQREKDWHYSRMISSICKVNELRKKHESQTNKVYDLVVIHRFDVITGPKPESYLQNILSLPNDPLSIFVPSGNEYRFYPELWRAGINDIIFSGDSLAMDLLSAWMFRKFEVAPKEFDISFRYGPNAALREAVHECNILTKHVHGQFAIVRENADMSNSVFDSYDYHKTFWVDNHPGIKGTK